MYASSFSTEEKRCKCIYHLLSYGLPCHPPNFGCAIILLFRVTRPFCWGVSSSPCFSSGKFSGNPELLRSSDRREELKPTCHGVRGEGWGFCHTLHRCGVVGRVLHAHLTKPIYSKVPFAMAAWRALLVSLLSDTDL